MNVPEQQICAVCSKPVLPGQAHNGATGNHWDCQPAGRNAARDASDSLTEAGRALERAKQAVVQLQQSLKRRRR